MIWLAKNQVYMPHIDAVGKLGVKLRLGFWRGFLFGAMGRSVPLTRNVRVPAVDRAEDELEPLTVAR